MLQVSGVPTNILQKAVLGVHSFGNCVAEWKRRMPGLVLNPSTQICAGEKGKDSCKGDSGGPLLIMTGSERYVQSGITSFGSRDCGDGTPGVYTKVSAFIKWIKGKLRP